MADIIIKGMEMPTSCGLCPMFCDDFNDYCSAAQRSIPFDAEKPEWCPLVPLPARHGRLIDADALAAQFQKLIVNEDDLMELCKRAGLMSNYYNESKVQVGMVTFMRMLYDAKTIVPAEGGNVDGN